MLRTFLLLLAFGITTLISEEISVFNAGNLDADEPYGLTQSEKKILENKKRIEKLLIEKKILKNEIKELKSTVATLQELIRNLGKESNEHRLKIATLIDDLKQNNLVTEITYKEIKENLNQTKKQVKKQGAEAKKTLNEKIKESFQQVNDALKKQDERLVKIEKGFAEDFKSVEKKLVSIGQKLERINSEYVSQKQLDFVVEEFNTFKETVIAEFEKLSKERDDYYDFSKHSNQEIFRDAKKNLELGKYKEAIKFFSYLINQHYRPATDNFYIGESYYFQGNYEQAIKHYKESVAIYDKSSFMPTLLLHSGLSLEKLNDIEQAKSFYSALITGYKDSVEAKRAKKLLNQLEK